MRENSVKNLLIQFCEHVLSWLIISIQPPLDVRSTIFLHEGGLLSEWRGRRVTINPDRPQVIVRSEELSLFSGLQFLLRIWNFLSEHSLSSSFLSVPIQTSIGWKFYRSFLASFSQFSIHWVRENAKIRFFRSGAMIPKIVILTIFRTPVKTWVFKIFSKTDKRVSHCQSDTEFSVSNIFTVLLSFFFKFNIDKILVTTTEKYAFKICIYIIIPLDNDSQNFHLSKTIMVRVLRRT